MKLPAPDYAANRQRRYPSVADQLDALWKSLPAGMLGPEGEAMRQRILAIKAAVPKPREPGSDALKQHSDSAKEIALKPRSDSATKNA